MYSVVLLVFLVSPSCGVPLEQLYRWGEDAGDRFLPRNVDDSGSEELALTVPITFYSKTYHSVFINANGLLSFRIEIGPFLNMAFPLDYPVIAPFYSDVDTRKSGTVYYRESKETDLLQRMEDDIVKHFSSVTNFSPLSLLIVTWHDVGYFDQQSDKTNTFQVVIGSSSEDSFCLLLYADDGIKWIQGQGKNPDLPDAGAQAGFMSENGELYTLRGSGTDQMFNIDKWSNINEPGAYLFRVGQTGELDNVIPPDTRIYEVEASTCAIGASTCHSKALCLEYTPGFCCQCDNGYYGNGISCLLDGEPKRVNGKISGIVNGESIEEQDYHAYVVTSDGRAYTAISKVPPHIGYDMQSISMLASSIAWMFAVMRSEDTKNGFQLSGGLLNRTVNMEFPQTGHHVRIEQQFLGFDVYNQLRISTTFEGTIPTIPITKELQIEDYEQKFTKVKPGEYKSEMSLQYKLKGNEISSPFNVEETFSYIPCTYAPYNDDPDTLRIKIARNFIVYNSEEEILRYAMSSKTVSLSEKNPCDEEDICGRHSTCVPDGDAYRCECNAGYDRLYTDATTSTCVDVNECNERRHNCHVNAVCQNYDGGFQCHCDHGYIGNGVECHRQMTCNDVHCDLNGFCHEVSPGRPECQCHEGYSGDGYVCNPSTDISDTGDCGGSCAADAYCQYDVSSQSHICVCRPGYQGNGQYCEEAPPPAKPEPDCGYFYCTCPEGWTHNATSEECDLTSTVAPPEPCGGQCSLDGKCQYDYITHEEVCVCLPGYRGDGFFCEEDEPPKPDCVIHYCSCPEGWRHENLNGSRCVKEERTPVSCHHENDCHPNAQCEYDILGDRYHCVCIYGYEGNGHECISSSESCEHLDVCGFHGKCIIDQETSQPMCVCEPGYKGDGIICEPEDECETLRDCPENAECKSDEETGRFHCVCMTGFTSSDDGCTPTEDDCSVSHNCHEDAACEYQHLQAAYVCMCNEGYIGNGYFCKPHPERCDIVNQCTENADCVPNEEGAEYPYRCQCRAGYEGDGIQVCSLIRTCADDISVCDPHASCVGSGGQFYCHCNRGFTGNGTTCAELEKIEGNILFVSQGISILKIPFEPTPYNPGRPIIISPLQTAAGMDIHCQTGRLYWADVTGGVIRSSDFNGANRKPLVNQDVQSPEDVSVDWISGNVYWTDSGKDTIEVINIESGNRKVLIEERLVNPRGIAVHPGLGRLFWTDWDRNEPKIEEASMDGTDRRDLIIDNLGLPNSLTIDFLSDELCWADAGSKLIECFSFRHYRRREISPASYPFGLTNSRDKFFWTDWDEKTVITIDKRYQENVGKLQIPLGGSSRYYDIVAVPTECPLVSSECEFNQGGCSPNELCLPNSFGRHSCLCADNLKANQTCG